MEAAWNIPRTLANTVTPGAAIAKGTTLCWDVDGVLAFAAEALITALNAFFGTAYTLGDDTFFAGHLVESVLPPEQAAWAKAHWHEPHFTANMAPDWHAMDVLRDAYHAGWQCLVVSARPPDLEKVTADWLDSWGCPLPAENVHAVGHGNKPQWMSERFGPARPAALVDDSPGIEVTIARPGIETWLPARPYNRGPERPHAHRFRTWAEMRYALGLGPQG